MEFFLLDFLTIMKSVVYVLLILIFMNIFSIKKILKYI